MRLTAAGQSPCEEYVTNKSAVTKEELLNPKTRSRVVLKHQVQKIETSEPESKANITEDIDSETKTEDEKSEQTAGVVKSLRNACWDSEQLPQEKMIQNNQLHLE